jgi:hypothetical protein
VPHLPSHGSNADVGERSGLAKHSDVAWS